MFDILQIPSVSNAVANLKEICEKSFAEHRLNIPGHESNMITAERLREVRQELENSHPTSRERIVVHATVYVEENERSNMFPNMYMSKKGASVVPDTVEKQNGLGVRNYLVQNEERPGDQGTPFGYSLGRVAISNNDLSTAEIVDLVKIRLTKVNLDNINFSDIIEKIGDDLIGKGLKNTRYSVELYCEYGDDVKFVGSHWNLDTWVMRYKPSHFWYVIKEENLTPTEELNRAFSDVKEAPAMVGDHSQKEDQAWQ